MNSDQDTNETSRVPVRCFKCAAGCVHLEYGNAQFTFTQPQFRALAEVIGAAYRQLQAEHETDEKESLDLTAPLVM
jgi:hypothetical protein